MSLLSVVEDAVGMERERDRDGARSKRVPPASRLELEWVDRVHGRADDAHAT
jgi:hypothetical protein